MCMVETNASRPRFLNRFTFILLVLWFAALSILMGPENPQPYSFDQFRTGEVVRQTADLACRAQHELDSLLSSLET